MCVDCIRNKLVNIRKNIDVIKRRDDVIKLLGDNDGHYWRTS